MLNDDISRFDSKNRRILIELIAILNHFSSREKGLVQIEKVNFIKRLNLEYLNDVFLSPAGRQWIYISYSAIKGDEKSKDLLINYSNWAGIEYSNLNHYLIRKLDEFLFSLLILSGQPPDFSLSLEVKNSILHFNNSLWKSNDIASIDINLGTTIKITTEKENLTLAVIKENKKLEYTFFKLPESDKFPFYVDLFSEASRANFPGREHLPRVPYKDKKTITQQVIKIEKALGFIKDANASIYDYFINTKNYFVPLFGPEGALPSSSNSTVDTMFWYSITDQALLISEMIIHELSHQRLFRLQDEDPLIDPVFHNSGWEKCELYSPWRDHPRPINGVFHGFIVFSEVSKFWLELIKNADINEQEKNIAKRRMAMLTLQLSNAKESLDNTHFTSKGKEFYDQYVQYLNNDTLKYVQENNLGDLEPFFMEFHDQEELVGQSIYEVVDEHKNHWLTNNI